MVACHLQDANRLPADHHDVHVLSELEHLSDEETARRLSLSPGTVEVRLHRARTRIQGELRSHRRCYCNERGELTGEPKRSST